MSTAARRLALALVFAGSVAASCETECAGATQCELVAFATRQCTWLSPVKAFDFVPPVSSLANLRFEVKGGTGSPSLAKYTPAANPSAAKSASMPGGPGGFRAATYDGPLTAWRIYVGGTPGDPAFRGFAGPRHLLGGGGGSIDSALMRDDGGNEFDAEGGSGGTASAIEAVTGGAGIVAGGVRCAGLLPSDTLMANTGRRRRGRCQLERADRHDGARRRRGRHRPTGRRRGHRERVRHRRHRRPEPRQRWQRLWGRLRHVHRLRRRWRQDGSLGRRRWRVHDACDGSAR